MWVLVLQIRTTNRRSPQRMQTCKKQIEKNLLGEFFDGEKSHQYELKNTSRQLNESHPFAFFSAAANGNFNEKLFLNKIVFLLCFRIQTPH